MSKDSAYRAALDICSGEQDWKGLVLAIAKENPQVVVDAFGGRYGTVSSQQVISSLLQQELSAIIRSGQRIGAIKHLRQATSWGLKEAKDYIDRHWPA